MLSRIRCIFVFIQFSLTVAFIIIAMYFFKNYTHNIIKFWMKIQIYLLGIKLEVHGKLDDSAEMIIINHQSILDIIVMEHLHSKNLAWVAKKEISDIVFFGHIIKIPKMISVDRHNKAGILKLLKDVKSRLNLGRPIAMFPEGTRSTGKKMLKFKSGAAMVANKLKLKVQPVVIINTKDVLDSQKLTATPGIVKVIYLDTIQADRNTNWFEETEKNMNEVFNKEMN
ncbi:MAG: 1-acyl-sn-glycerol-3-phosphate acyltransferase [Arcobacter sp.]|nr:1-acyl-sn-glycerol-3-phosphate acyltransferase [Arcobacter sp.]